MDREAYNNRFSGIERLYGKASLDNLSKAHVMIIGLGGVGSWTVEALARSGVGQISLVDFDDVCVSNTNRQLHALDGNYGTMKTQVLQERIHQINPECSVSIFEMFYSERTASTILECKPSIVIDAIDAIKAKCHLLATCKAESIPVICCGGAGGRSDLLRIQVDDMAKAHGDKLVASVRNTLRSRYNFPKGVGKKIKKFHIPTVFSDEPMVLPASCDIDSTTPQPKNLNCASGYGAVTHVTATFGLTLAQLALTHLRTSGNGS